MTFNNLIVPTIIYPFGIEDIGNMTFPSYDISKGLGRDKCAPNGLFTRHDFNAIGYMATMGAFLDRAGYQPGFDYQPASGYPKGAILADTRNNRVIEYLNTVEANTLLPDLGDIAESSNGWVPLWDDKQFDFFPNFDDRTVLLDSIVNTTTSQRQFTVSGGKGWYLVTRTVENWDLLTDAQRVGTYTDTAFDIAILAISDDTHTEHSYEWEYNSIHLYEGKTATRIFPVSGSIRIRVDDTPAIGPVSLQVAKFGMEEIS